MPSEPYFGSLTAGLGWLSWMEAAGPLALNCLLNGIFLIDAALWHGCYGYG